MQNVNYKLQIFSCCLLSTIYCLLISGCGKKQPIGYGVVKDREGEIRTGSCEVVSWAHRDTFAYMTTSLLFAGKDTAKEFSAMAFIQFEFDSAVSPETLWITGSSSGRVDMFKVDSINIDSLTWGDRPPEREMEILWKKPYSLVRIEKDSAISIYVGKMFRDSDSVFCIGFSGDYGGILSFYASNCLLSIEEDTENTYKPDKSAYIDTSYFSLDDSLLMVQTGAYITRCSLNVALLIGPFITEGDTDSVKVVMDTLSIDSIVKDTIVYVSMDSMYVSTDTISMDSLRHLYKLDSATVNKAIFKIPIDTSLSYEENISVYPEYDGTFCLCYNPVGDTLSLNMESIVDKWFKEGESASGGLWFVLHGDSKKISRVVMDIRGASLNITYSLPPKRR